MATVYPEVIVCCEYDRIRNEFAHSDDACIGEIDRQVRVFPHQIEYRATILLKGKRDRQRLPMDKLQNRRPSMYWQYVESL